MGPRTHRELAVSQATAADQKENGVARSGAEGDAGVTPIPGSAESPAVALRSLDTLWFQVGGTLCNLTCTHCFISCSPTNPTHEILSLETVRAYLEEAVELGVKEYYFTGGEPFINREMEDILAETLQVGPAMVSR